MRQLEFVFTSFPYKSLLLINISAISLDFKNIIDHSLSLGEGGGREVLCECSTDQVDIDAGLHVSASGKFIRTATFM